MGQAIRAVRIRRGWRQEDLARSAGLHRSAISRIERGHVGTLTVDTLRRIGSALEIRIEVTPRWRGGELDRLLNARHSAFHEVIARRFAKLAGWLHEPEVSFSIFGERGVIDILAYHPGRRALLIIELKTELVDVQEMVGSMDRRRRLARRIAAGRGWAVTTVSTWVFAADTTTNRRRVAAHKAFLGSAFPHDGPTLSRWLADPRGEVQGLSFVSYALPGHAMRRGSGAQRVRRASRVAA